MKRFAVVVAVLLVAVASTRAQIQFGIGLKTGLNLSTVSADPDPYAGLSAVGISSKKSGGTSFSVGAAAEVGFAKMFAIAIEPGYTQKSAKWELTQGQATASDERTVGYLQVPILFRVKFIEGPVRPYAFVGPNLGLVLSSKQKVQGFANIQDGEYDAKSTTSSLDFGLEFGSGAEFKVAKQISLTGDVRYNLGLSNLDNSPAQQGGQALSVKSRSFVILLGVLFFI